MPERMDKMAEALVRMGGEREVFEDEGTAHLAIDGNRVLSGREVDGLTVQATERVDGVDLDVVLAEGVRLVNPVHMCFGVMRDEAVQRLNIKVRLCKGASARFIAHCMFPTARKVLHTMDAEVELAEGAEMTYNESHFHGPYGGVEVAARARVSVAPHGRYSADFSLLNGLVGSLGLDYAVRAHERSVVELTARVFGHEHDVIRINESVVLAGAWARSIIKTRVALEGQSSAEVRGMTEGAAPHARGHVDCTEIVRQRATANAIPVVLVTHPEAKVTHEAAIGSVDKAQMETLCARGLTPEEAVDIIVKGLLR